jgi:hypothetical protein
VAGRPVVGDIRVQEVSRRDARCTFTIVSQGGAVYGMPDRFLRQRAGGTDRTYAYLLVDHLRWLEFEGLSPTTVTFPDLQRYMAAVGAEYTGPFGRPWRPDRRPYSRSTLQTLAACLKGFYVFQGSQGEGIDLAQAFKTAPAAVAGRPSAHVPWARCHPAAREPTDAGEDPPAGSRPGHGKPSRS